MRKLICYIILLLFASTGTYAQSTRIKGKITDNSTGDPLPFAGIYFTGSTIGVSSDFDGIYKIETREKVKPEITISMLGYKTQTVKVRLNAYNEINIALSPDVENLSSITVKPDDRKIRALFKRITDKKDSNNPYKYDLYDCNIYTKMELDIMNVKPYFNNKKLQKNFGFVFNNMDTSVVSGKAYLPIMITESNAKFYHRSNPALSREIIEASRISGVNEDYSLAQFTGHLHAKVNLYDNYINIFNVQLASPLNEHGFMFYNYYIVDSLNIKGRKNYKIRFHPKGFSTPVLDGEINLDSLSCAITSAHVRMAKGVNVNWIKDLVIDTQSEYVNDTLWFPSMDKLYADFSITNKDSSKIYSFLGHRTVNYSNFNIGRPIPESVEKEKNNVVINENVLNNNESYWQKSRPYKLSSREKGIYSMVDSIKNVPLYHDIYTIVNTILGGYYDTKYLSFGPYYKLFSFNNLEGMRFQFGARTTEVVNKKIRLGAYGAYGTKDKDFKGGASAEYVFDRQPFSKITAKVSHDAVQLGRGVNALTESNILSSILSRGGQKLSLVNRAEITFEQELKDGVNSSVTLLSRCIFPSKYVKLESPDGTSGFGNVNSEEIGLGMRFSWNEMVNRGIFDRTYLTTSYPILTFNASAGIKGIYSNDYEYYRVEGGLIYDLQIPPIGTSHIIINSGKIFGKVPYPLLKLHEGNGTYVYDPMAFSCMDYYEFASDTWISMFYEHNFKGFLLGKIPFLKRLKWRSAFVLKGVYGTLNNKNNGSLANTTAILKFPEGMSSVRKPYVETGLGITNIFKLFRVGATWRLTHRKEDNSKGDNFALNFGVELSF